VNPQDHPWLPDLFRAIDRKDIDVYLAFMTPDAVFRFGSSEGIRGHDAIRAAVADFYATFDTLSHELDRAWSGADTLVVEGRTTYTRHDGSRVTVPFADVFELEGDRIAHYAIYADMTPLYGTAD
jgi:ketosteroid isomerase-like protein